MNVNIDNNAPYARFLGKSYELNPKTLAIVKMYEELEAIPKMFATKKMTYEEVLATQFSFLAATLKDGNPFAEKNLDEVDVDEVRIACTAVIKGYEKRVKLAEYAGILNGIPKTADVKKKKKKNK